MESRQVGSGRCYVCGGQNPSPSLMRPCRCDRLVHAECLGGVRALESWVCPSCNTPLPVVDHQLRPSWRFDRQPCYDRLLPRKPGKEVRSLESWIRPSCRTPLPVSHRKTRPSPQQPLAFPPYCLLQLFTNCQNYCKMQVPLNKLISQ